MQAAPLPKTDVAETIPPLMIREMVEAERNRRGWNLLRLATESGAPYRTIHDWLSPKGKGERGPSVENLEKIMRALGLKVSRRSPRRPRRP